MIKVTSYVDKEKEEISVAGHEKEFTFGES